MLKDGAESFGTRVDLKITVIVRIHFELKLTVVFWYHLLLVVNCSDPDLWSLINTDLPKCVTPPQEVLWGGVE